MISTDSLRRAQDRLVRARTAGAKISVDARWLQLVVNELLQRREQDPLRLEYLRLLEQTDAHRLLSSPPEFRPDEEGP